jgi:hypothetical protein
VRLLLLLKESLRRDAEVCKRLSQPVQQVVAQAREQAGAPLPEAPEMASTCDRFGPRGVQDKRSVCAKACKPSA